MNALGQFITRFFSMINIWLSSAEKLGSAVHNLTIIADEGSGALADTQRIRREINVKKIYAELGVTPNVPAATTVQ